MKKLFCFTFVIAFCFAITSAHAISIVNGGFEEPVLAYGTWYGSYTSIPGWTATFGTIEIQNNVAGAPYQGFQHVELDSYSNSGMEQLIPTLQGQTYNLSFAYSPRPSVSYASNWINAYFEGSLFASISAQGGNVTSWTVYNYTVTARNNGSKLEFRAGGTSDSLGGYLDAVSIRENEQTPQVPEPSTIFLLGSLVSGLFGAVSLRKKI
ncbi:MAG: PEP-CTERM sorting domain-containing protein [bacterium]|nr:PEP-CTERM sorting domain-containing protein [bacterium]